MQSYMETAAELGVDGWMADFTEWAPIDVEFEDGTDPWHFHNRYPIRFQETVRAAMEAVHDGSDGEATNNWTYFARSGWASVNGGSGGVTPTLWGGDQNTNWEYDDGFPTVVPIAAHVGMSGVPIFGSDVAGYNALFGTPTTKELFYRWSAMAAFQGLMRTHHGSNECANWAFDRDLETLEHYRRYAVIHSLLYPVFRSLATEARETGLPLVRHPYLVAPEARWMWQGDQYQFFLGDDLLVAPVLEQGATSREVAVPATGWWPLFGDGPVEAETGGDGSRSVSVDAPATELPVLVRPGTALPLLGEPVDSFYGASEEGVSDLDAVDRYRLVLYPDVDGNVRDADVGGVAATLASGWNTVDWGAPTLDGEALPTCEGTSATSCVDGVRALLVGGGLFVAGGATIELTAEVDDVGVWIGVGGAGWVPWDAETTLTDINPDIPPPCEEGE
jgi:alpha-glucosidase (family GH31 glycosyl hydrolase)